MTTTQIAIDGRAYWVRSTPIRVHGLDWWSADVYDADLLAIARTVGTRESVELARVAESRAASEGTAIAQAVYIARRNKTN